VFPEFNEYFADDVSPYPLILKFEIKGKYAAMLTLINVFKTGNTNACNSAVIETSLEVWQSNNTYYVVLFALTIQAVRPNSLSTANILTLTSTDTGKIWLVAEVANNRRDFKSVIVSPLKKNFSTYPL